MDEVIESRYGLIAAMFDYIYVENVKKQTIGNAPKNMALYESPLISIEYDIKKLKRSLNVTGFTKPAIIIPPFQALINDLSNAQRILMGARDSHYSDRTEAFCGLCILEEVTKRIRATLERNTNKNFGRDYDGDYPYFG